MTPVYRDKGSSPFADKLAALQEVVEELAEYTQPELMNRLREAVTELEVACRAEAPVVRGSHRVGYGVNEAKKNVACDTATSVIREIKKARGW